ncbi:putative lipoprotein with Yx(FWY)xxD motif [Amycolatopsis lexingtonensis]|uniref:Lipoprotein with Yx(FWY)xxD motif n=1 Tax=Amycolatopsis lexingtonensis TaxID=218822 RepID=A0ABR9I8J6_9PSEU|nr:SCO0930 family lipoprotein [Amycolatopsis lexingtonensis]MBE1499297.1 putative lipoprotein with Yx(FWY)xxD motif [Amycolatopsis lexingtonensis]
MLRTRIAVSVAAAAAGLAVLTACSGAETAQPVIAPAAAGGTGGGQLANGQVGNAAPASNESKLVVADVANVGQVLTDQNGMTLYRFDKDTAKPPKSNCDGDCAKAWPPLLSTGDVEVQGVDKSLVGKVTRSDGTEQITVGGWALYRYAKDTKAGEATGQGVGGAWYAANAKGGKAGQAAAEAGAVKLSASKIDGLGDAIVDQNGMTLYLFTKDTKKAKTSACNGDCAKTWPAVLSNNGKVELQGIDSKLLGSIKRADGTEQVTIGGWPVYTFSKDLKPGDANGMGVNGTWFVIEPNGCKVGTTPSSATNQAPADSGAGSSNSGAGGTTY